MTPGRIRDFDAHIYFHAGELERGRSLAKAARELFSVQVGHLHQRPVGPHPRGSVQMTVPPEQFGEFASGSRSNRAGLTIFAHASTGNDRADHHDHVIWSVAASRSTWPSSTRRWECGR